MAEVKKVVVLGGGYAGVLTAKGIAKKAKKNKLMSDIEITLIDKNPFHTMLTELHEVAANRVEEESIKMDLKKIFAGRNVKVALDNISNIDFGKNTLTGHEKTYDYDYLVIGTGSKPAYWGVNGAEENAFPLWSFDDAVKLKEHTLARFRKAEKETNPTKRKELLTFFVVGMGFTGVEMIGELAEWMPELCEQYHINKKEISMYIVDIVDRVIRALPEKLSAKATRRLEKMGVRLMTNTSVVDVQKDSVTLEINGKQVKHKTSTVIWTAGIEGSEIVSSADIEKAKGKRIETNEYLQSKQYENVYIVGDNIFYIPKGEKESVPQMVENCEASAHTASDNVIADIMGQQGKKHSYNPKFHGMMVCIGGKYGTAYVGTHKTKFALPSFFAMLSKHLINIVYFIQVLGWNKVWSYLQHEIFRVKNNRSFVGGHFANYSPNFWAVPLRLFLGYSWLSEGLTKLPKIITDFNTIFLFTIPGADGTTSASLAETASSASEYGKALPVPEFIKEIVDWSMGVFIAPIAPYFQAFMVLAEIVVGICLILGLFTAVISIFSAMLCLMIYSSGMAAETIIWNFVAAIAIIGIGGTGQVFALDYYVMPWLKKKWKEIGFVRKWYIYND